MYYNLIPCPDIEEDRDEECIYDVISEKHHHVPERISPVVLPTKPLPITITATTTTVTMKPPTKALPTTPIMTTATINSDKKATQNESEKPKNSLSAMSSRSVLIQDEIYELVN